MPRTQCLEEVIFQEVTLRVPGVNRPPVVRKDVENAENQDEECCRPLGFEANGNHYACCHTQNGNDNTCNAPVALQDETQEKENEQDASSEQEAKHVV
jgi:hypothetical protein